MLPWWSYVAYGLVGLVAWRTFGGAVAFGWDYDTAGGSHTAARRYGTYVKPGDEGWEPSYGAGVVIGFVGGVLWPLVILVVLASKVTLPPWPLPSSQEREHRKRLKDARIKELERKVGL